MPKILKFGKLVSPDREFDYELKSQRIDLNGVTDLMLWILQVADFCWASSCHRSIGTHETMCCMVQLSGPIGTIRSRSNRSDLIWLHTFNTYTGGYAEGCRRRSPAFLYVEGGRRRRVAYAEGAATPTAHVAGWPGVTYADGPDFWPSAYEEAVGVLSHSRSAYNRLELVILSFLICQYSLRFYLVHVLGLVKIKVC